LLGKDRQFRSRGRRCLGEWCSLEFARGNSEHPMFVEAVNGLLPEPVR
jgi:hypothetical protein